MQVYTDHVAMALAALLYFNESVADLVHWIGGPHVDAHQDHAAILDWLVHVGINPKVVTNLHCIFCNGIPAYCNAKESGANFLAYYQYGNHMAGNL